MDIVKVLHEFEADCQIYDPWANPKEVSENYNVETISDYSLLKGKFDAIILAVSHTEFITLNYDDLKKINNR
ncbi:UDP binding domain-containing protein [Mucilaginibacter antarcticus]|uniref:UDP binding domain-containing protein n=1 Tax=Mucilaginibacter antarcticus TaxID=1855725 RepID=UPI00363FC3A8